MAVLRVVCHRGNQISVVLDPSFWKVSPDFVLAVHGFSIRKANGLPKSAGHFRHHLIRPFRQKRRGPAASLRSVSAKGIGTRTQTSRTTGRAPVVRAAFWEYISLVQAGFERIACQEVQCSQTVPCLVSWQIPRHHEDKRGVGCQLDDGLSNPFQAA
jgi:hypothetical protein